MAHDPLDTDEADFWRINQARLNAWRSWDGEVVVYDDCSGDTLKLDVVMAEAFRRLLEAPASRVQLVGHLASVFNLEGDLRLQHLTALAIERLKNSGLIEPVNRCSGSKRAGTPG